ncbi:MAG: TonB-dependent receptor [Candidatus Cloacimonetes bacterium]|nr:TonB-dependent receptor [Candidatus Cloacimonadota bacterium]
MKNSMLTVIILLLIIPMSLLAQTGKIAGKIINKESKEPLEGVSVFIEKLQLGTYTQQNGTYILKDVPIGKMTINVRYMGYESVQKEIEVETNMTAVANFELAIHAVQVEGMRVSANRAVARETPVSFTNVSEEIIKEKYTTGDMPQMLDDIPGLFSTTSGLGESEITMRGFDAQKIQILINGVPVNDPESQVVYWSNWTGLSSNVKSVQVQRGAGASLYGSGAFGGSVNIETMGSENDQELTIRTSSGYYFTDGQSADEFGVMGDYDPINYNLLFKYDSGKIFNDKFKYNITAERKAGDYYIRGTEYDGWSFGFESENRFPDHVVNTSFIVAPQKHNQARSTYDPELGKYLGREFNFTNHPWQENKYKKPQLSVRDRWALSSNSYLMTNVFVTKGEGGGSYANNIIFDAESGALLFRPLATESQERRQFAQYAYYVYDQTGYLLDGFVYDPVTTGGTYTWAGDDKTVYSGSNTFSGDANHSGKMTSYNVHDQVGMNSYFDKDVTEYLNLIVGAEGRLWKAHHYKEGTDFRYYNPLDPDSVSTFDAYYRDYDYSSKVVNTSGFARAKINIPFNSVIEKVNFMLDGQYAIYYSEVDENMIHFFDPINGEFIDEGYYASKMDSITVWQYEPNGDSTQVYISKFDEEDYKRTFSFFSPKIGMNINLNKQWNVLANYSIVYKEPTVGDWYDRVDGPGVNQVVDNKEFELVPEKGETIEAGFGYRDDKYKFEATYYHTKYTDKIESITDLHGDSKTVNAGVAVHQGIELALNGRIGNYDFNSSATFSKNRWGDLNFQNIFYENAADVEGKTVPYSPEKMASGGFGYTFQEMPLNGKLRIGMNAKWTDDYYTTYDNVYCKQLYYYDDNGDFQSIGEHEFVENPDGTGHYDYDDASGEYYINFSNTGEFDREWIMRSSKLPAFFELNGSLSYNFYIGNHETSIKLNVNNILNKDDNYSKAYIGRAYGMQIPVKDDDGNIIGWNDPVFGEGATSGNSTGGGYYPYLSPAPLLNVFLTIEYKF